MIGERAITISQSSAAQAGDTKDPLKFQAMMATMINPRAKVFVWETSFLRVRVSPVQGTASLLIMIAYILMRWHLST
jgi:hypothetical protein